MKDEASAKLQVLEELRDMCREIIGDKFGKKRDEMKQVSVAAPDSEQLKEGLDLASAMLDDAELEEEPEVVEDDDDEDLEAIERKIAELEAKKARLKV